MTTELPHDPRAEASVLGAVLLRERLIPDVRELATADFFNPRHRLVWDAMRALDARQAPLDPVTLEAELATMNALNAVGGCAALSDLALCVPTADNAAYYAGLVRERAQVRRLMLGLSDAAQLGYTGAQGAELYARARAALHEFEAEHSGFASAAMRLEGEAERRAALVRRELAFNISFIDDYLRGLLPHDLVVLGAYTGAGKTQLAQLVALANAKQGKRVFFLALEAEPDEIERRAKFAVLAELLYDMRTPGRERLNYPDWYRGRCADLVGPFETDADRLLRRQLHTLHTLYRGRDFDVDNIERCFRAVQDQAELIVLDHLHYVDSDDPNENRAVKDIVKRIRDVSLAIGVPVIVVAHLRKKDRGRRALVPGLDDFHGSSDITKIATAAILLSRAYDKESEHPWIAHTYVQIPKSRMGGACPYVAMMSYDLRRNQYEREYLLGRKNIAGDEIAFIDKDKCPRWARRHA